MDLQFKKLSAENVEGLSSYYGQRHDRTCDSVILDYFLWSNYYRVYYTIRDEKAILWTMNVDGNDYAAMPICSMEDLPHYFHELEQYFNETLKKPLEIYLADEAAHEVKRAGTECFDRLVTLLGSDIVGEDGEINKAVMADKIFGDEELLRQVNEIVHPAVKDYLMAKYEAALENPDIELFFVEAALLIEAGYKELVDEMWYIYSTQEVRRKRLEDSRGYSREKITDIMKSQLSEEEFRKNCDYVIDNSGSLEVTHQTIKKRLEEFTWVQ